MSSTYRDLFRSFIEKDLISSTWSGVKLEDACIIVSFYLSLMKFTNHVIPIMILRSSKIFFKAFDRVLYNRVILKRSCETRLYYHNTICHVKDILSHGNNSWDIVEARIPVGSIFAKAVTGDVLLKTCS